MTNQPFPVYNNRTDVLQFGKVHMTNAWIPPERLQAIRSHMHGRDAIITDILLETGFRIDDIMHMRKCNLSGRSVRLREKKTGHDRSAILSPETAARIAEYAAKRHTLAYLFPALRRAKRKKQHRTTYWRHFEEACKRSGYGDCGYTPHSLRKVYAVRMFRETGSLTAVQKDLGHTNISTTAIYALSDRL